MKRRRRLWAYPLWACVTFFLHTAKSFANFFGSSKAEFIEDMYGPGLYEREYTHPETIFYVVLSPLGLVVMAVVSVVAIVVGSVIALRRRKARFINTASKS